MLGFYILFEIQSVSSLFRLLFFSLLYLYFLLDFGFYLNLGLLLLEILYRLDLRCFRLFFDQNSKFLNCLFILTLFTFVISILLLFSVSFIYFLLKLDKVKRTELRQYYRQILFKRLAFLCRKSTVKNQIRFLFVNHNIFT